MRSRKLSFVRELFRLAYIKFHLQIVTYSYIKLHIVQTMSEGDLLDCVVSKRIVPELAYQLVNPASNPEFKTRLSPCQNVA